MKHILRISLLGSSLIAWEAQAHQIWIEQDGKVAQLHFGEYGENLKEISPGLLDKMPVPKASLESKQGKSDVKVSKAKDRFDLATKIASGDSVSAQVTDYPSWEDKEGEKPLRTKWIPAARAVVDFKERSPSNTLDIVPTGTEGKFKLFFKEKPLPATKLSLIAPNGWMKEVWTDDKGELTVNPLWKGTYLLEAQHKDTVPGEINGEKYDVASYTSTLSFPQAKGPETKRPEAAKPNKAT